VGQVTEIDAFASLSAVEFPEVTRLDATGSLKNDILGPKSQIRPPLSALPQLKLTCRATISRADF